MPRKRKMEIGHDKVVPLSLPEVQLSVANSIDGDRVDEDAVQCALQGYQLVLQGSLSDASGVVTREISGHAGYYRNIMRGVAHIFGVQKREGSPPLIVRGPYLSENSDGSDEDTFDLESFVKPRKRQHLRSTGTAQSLRDGKLRNSHTDRSALDEAQKAQKKDVELSKIDVPIRSNPTGNDLHITKGHAILETDAAGRDIEKSLTNTTASNEPFDENLGCSVLGAAQSDVNDVSQPAAGSEPKLGEISHTSAPQQQTSASVEKHVIPDATVAAQPRTSQIETSLDPEISREPPEILQDVSPPRCISKIFPKDPNALFFESFVNEECVIPDNVKILPHYEAFRILEGKLFPGTWMSKNKHLTSFDFCCPETSDFYLMIGKIDGIEIDQESNQWQLIALEHLKLRCDQVKEDMTIESIVRHRGSEIQTNGLRV